MHYGFEIPSLSEYVYSIRATYGRIPTRILEIVTYGATMVSRSNPRCFQVARPDKGLFQLPVLANINPW
jgi:hypothetical protein